MSATVTSLGSGRYLVHRDGRTSLAYAVGAGPRTWIFMEGGTALVDPAALRQDVGRAHSDDDVTALSAPMPATVVAVRVEAGQHVARGEVLLTLEAMKMELPVLAPRDGVVKAIACAPGDLVQPGIPLIQMD